LSEKIETKRCEPGFVEQSGQCLVRRAVLTGQEAMAEHDNCAGRLYRAAEKGGDQVALVVLERERFVHAAAL
jgi:hypothetical protein